MHLPKAINKFYMHFSDLNLIEPILRAVAEEGYTTPTPIQQQSIPIVLKSRDLLGCAQTGTGKTAAFAIPILQLLTAQAPQSQPRHIRSLILTPTRELAIQIEESFRAYGRHTKIKAAVIFGGVGQTPQVDMLRRGVDVLIATPGRLLDLIGQGYVSLKQLEIFVLDEADRMLDMGFIHDVKKVLTMLPKQRQSLFFSATMPPQIVQLANTILHNPESVTVTPVSSTVEIIQQSVYFVDKQNKNHLLLHLLENQDIKTMLVFTRTKHGADKVVKILMKHQIKAEAIHGNKAQNARQRALANFKSTATRVLVATDIAARGIDIDELAYVVNFELPNIPETYVHRIGRTGRAGAAGTAISFCDGEEKAYLRDIEKLINRRIEVVQDHPFPFTGATPPKEEREPMQHGRRDKPRHEPKSPPAQQRHQPRPQSQAPVQSAPLDKPVLKPHVPQRNQPQGGHSNAPARPNQPERRENPQQPQERRERPQQQVQQPQERRDRPQQVQQERRDPRPRPEQDRNAQPHKRPESTNQSSEGGLKQKSFGDLLKLLDHDERKAKQEARIKAAQKERRVGDKRPPRT
jgi:ATP-dependent RNA helicase RhlE